MQINSLYTNPYTKIYGQISEKNTTTPRLITLGNSQDVLVKQQSSQIAFAGLFSNLIKRKPSQNVSEILLSEAEKATQLAKKAAEEINKRIRRFNDDPNLVIMSYFTKTPYTKENAYEFTKYLDSHEIDIYKRYQNAPEYYKLWHQSISEAMDTAGQFNKHGIEDAQMYTMHMLLRDWEHYNFFNGIEWYLADMHLFPEDLAKLKEWINWAIPYVTPLRGEHIWNDGKGVGLYRSAIKKKNIPLLKFLTEDLKLIPFDLSAYRYGEGCKKICTAGEEIVKGREHNDPDVRKFFDDKHLYQIISCSDDKRILSNTIQMQLGSIFHIAEHASEDKGLGIFLKAAINSEKGLYERNLMLENAIRGLNYLFEPQEASYKLLSELPMSPRERRLGNSVLDTRNPYNMYFPRTRISNAMRAENIIRNNVQNNDFTIQSLKKCLDDKLMSPEILIQRGSGTSVFEEIAKIPVDDSNRADMAEIVQKIRDMKYLYHDGNALSKIGYNAAQHNNSDLLLFLKENHVDLSRASREFKDSSEVNDEIKQILSDVKPHDEYIISFTQYDSAEPFRSFAKTKLSNVDINSRDKNGSTLLLEAAKRGRVDLIHELAKIPEVDWNITDSVGKNVLMHTIDYASANILRAEEIIDILKSLSKNKFDINYINYCSNYICPYPHTAIQYYLSNRLDNNLLKKILEFSNADVNAHAPNSLPTAYIPCINLRPEQLKFLTENTDIDTLAQYNGRTLRQNLYSLKLFPNIASIEEAAPFERLLDNKANDIFVNKMKKIYDREGSFTLQQINDFLNYGQIEKIKEEPLNSIGEKISHFIAEISPDSENPEEVLELTKLFEKLKEKEVDLDALDEIGRSPMRKAIEADNPIAAKLFKDYGANPSDIEEIKLLCKESDNPEIRKLFE